MPKMKPHKSSKRRFAISSNGKIRFKRPGGGHLMSGKPGKRKRHLRHMVNITGLKLFNYVRELGIEGKWRRANVRAQTALVEAAGAEGGSAEQGEAKKGGAKAAKAAPAKAKATAKQAAPKK